MILRDRVKILLIDDDEDDFIIIANYIKSIAGFNATVDWCSRYNEALTHMCQKNYDIYFTDYRLGAKTGIDLLKESLEQGCEQPIVLLTGQGNYKVDLQAMELGAVDYLVKADLNSEKLERCIRYALERADTLKALRANERLYRGIFERSKDMIFVTDEHLNIIEVNEAVNTLLGYTREQCEGTNVCDLITQAQHKKFLQQSLHTHGELHDWELVLNDKTGDKKIVILNISKEPGADGKNYYQGIFHDITSLKKMEKANLKTEKMAVASRLVHTLAHEVRNPLNNINLSIEQIMEEEHDEGLATYFNIIKRNSKRINDIISELLSSSNPVEIALKPNILQVVTDNTIAAAIDRLNLKNIKLQVDYPSETLSILADKEKLTMALLNIVINAIEAMEEQKGMLSIKLMQKDTHAQLIIRDNGCGISEENLPRLFEPYFTQKRNGMGLGLALTLNILHAHNANVEVESEIGKGSTFNITFPLSGN